MKRISRHTITMKGLAFSLILIISSSDLTAIGSLAAEKEATTEVTTEVESVTVSKTITAVEPLDEDIAYQKIREKGDFKDLEPSQRWNRSCFLSDLRTHPD